MTGRIAARTVLVLFRQPLRSVGRPRRAFGTVRTSGGIRFCTANHDEFSQFAAEKERLKQERQKIADEEDKVRNDILSAGLRFVPQLGWTRTALQAGAQQLGYPQTMSSIIPAADVGLVHHHFQTANAELEESMKAKVEAAKAKNEVVKIGPFLKENIKDRLRMNSPYLHRWPDAIAIMSHPQNLPRSLQLECELLDSLWHYAGDRSTDFNWYTKRGSLLVIYKTTEIAMMQDKSKDFQDTWKFLDRRFEDHFHLASFFNKLSPSSVETAIGGISSTLQVLLGIQRR